MWSKIKHLAIPISIKLTVLYAVILSCILVFTSALTVAGLYYVFYTQAADDIGASANNALSYLASDHSVGQRMLKENLLVPGVVLRIFDKENNLLLDSAPYLPGNHALTKEDKEDLNPLKFIPLKKRYLSIVHVNHVYFYYLNQEILQGDQVYHLHFMKPLSEQSHFLKTLIKSLLVTNSLGLLAAIISGIYISRRILHPIRVITDTAKEIEVNDLGKRIEQTGSNDELEELARTFNHMLNRIQSGFEQQRRFVSDASHELRTPITVISGYADMLDRWGKKDPAALEEGITAIKSETANMHNLIEKLLFLARADQGKQVMRKIPVNVEHLIEEIAQETRLIAPNHHVSLSQNDPATILIDASAIKQMLRIFIENSIKYTPTGGMITIASQKVEQYLEVIIKDTGIGIPEKDQHKIFNRFYRVDKSRSKDTGGTGLGLSIAKWIADNHDSTIRLTSKAGEGTTITVRFLLIDSAETKPT